MDTRRTRAGYPRKLNMGGSPGCPRHRNAWGNIANTRARAIQFGIDFSHIGQTRDPGTPTPFSDPSDQKHLRNAALYMAAAWFERRGYAVSVPLGSRPYDLLVEVRGALYKIQIKTTSKRDRMSGVPVCNVGRTPNAA
jgi:hypothetical protein